MRCRRLSPNLSVEATRNGMGRDTPDDDFSL